MRAFLMGFFRDPAPGHKPSMARLCAFILTLLTVWAVVHTCSVAMVSVLLTGGVVSLLTRHKGAKKHSELQVGSGSDETRSTAS